MHLIFKSAFSAFLPIAFTTVATMLSACGGGSSTPVPAKQSALSLSTLADNVMNPFMAANGVTAANLTIMRNGAVLYEHGYGYLEAAKTTALPANALMLTASIVKPVTAAAVQKLASAGTLALTDHVFCTGANLPCWLPADLLSASSDARAKDITIVQLIAHQGGWDRSITPEPDESVVQKLLGITTPPQQSDDIRYLMARPLDFTPGTKTVYSNIGYLLLGRIIEQASKTSYIEYVNANIFIPLGIASADFQAAASLLKDRSPREPNYLTTLRAPSVYVPGTMVLAIDGALNAINWVSAAAVVSTSRAMATFAGNYMIQTSKGGNGGADGPQNGIPLAGKFNDGYHNGSAPGTASIVRQLPSGVSYAVLMNKRDDVNGDAYQDSVKTQLDAAIATFLANGL